MSRATSAARTFVCNQLFQLAKGMRSALSTAGEASQRVSTQKPADGFESSIPVLQNGGGEECVGDSPQARGVFAALVLSLPFRRVQGARQKLDTILEGCEMMLVGLRSMKCNVLELQVCSIIISE